MRKNKILTLLGLIFILTISAGIISCANLKTLTAPQNIKVEKRIVTWDKVENAVGYAFTVKNEIYETKDCEFDLHFILEEGDYEFQIMALGDKIKYADSDWASAATTLTEAVEHGYDEFGFKYTLLKDFTGYEVSMGKSKPYGVITIPDYFGDYPVTRIAYKAFYLDFSECFTEGKCNIVTTGINLPKTLKTIGALAFSNMVRLEEIIIPDSVTAIERDAFRGCTHMTKVVLPEGLKKIPQSCFENTALSEITFPDTLEEIEKFAFRCLYVDLGPIMHIESKLSEIVLPDSVVSIDSQAFKGRENLRSIKMSNNIEYLASEVFNDTLWYESRPDGFVFLNDDILYDYKGEIPADADIQIPKNVKKIASFVFVDQKNLTHITIPEGVQLIGIRALSGCESLTEVILPDDLKSIPKRTFLNSYNLKSINLPSGLNFIGDMAFMRTNIENIDIPKSVKIIEPWAFRLTNIESIIIPKSVELLGERSLDSKCISSIYYEGNAEQWKNILEYKNYKPQNENSVRATIYYYSETQKEGNYWHYVDGKPVVWN